jgi:hypothetical protein
MGYDNGGWTYAHGGNGSNGSLLYTATQTLSSSGASYALALSLKDSNIPGNPSPTVTVPQSIPTNGTCQTSVGTLSTEDQSTYGTLSFTVKGTPCSLTATATDNTGLNYNYAYTNLSTGYTYNFAVSVPSSSEGDLRTRASTLRPDSFTRGECYALEIFGLSLAIIAAILDAIALPEELAGAAYVVAMGGTIRGLTWAAISAGILHYIGCA